MDPAVVDAGVAAIPTARAREAGAADGGATRRRGSTRAELLVRSGMESDPEAGVVAVMPTRLLPPPLGMLRDGVIVPAAQAPRHTGRSLLLSLDCTARARENLFACFGINGAQRAKKKREAPLSPSANLSLPSGKQLPF